MRHQSDPAGAPRAALQSMGCRLNHAETAVLRRRLEDAGYRIVPWGETAELCVLNSCTVTLQSDAKARQALRAVRRRYPAARLALVGCYAQVDGERLAGERLADVVVGNAEKLRLVEHLDGVAAGGPPRVVRPRIGRAPFRLPAHASEAAGTRAHLKVQDGCSFGCGFCIIPRARGGSRPRAFGDLLGEAETLAAAGVQELVLTGVNVGTYDEGGRTLVDVVDALAGLPGPPRLRISSIEPTTVDEGLLERMGDRAHPLAPFLHLPLQSGSACILAAMRRKYGPGDYRAFAGAALARAPELCLGTDVMVGHPGEDAGAFAETEAFLDSLPFAYFHVFPYSPRPGTPAAARAGQVPAPDRQARAARLRGRSAAAQAVYQQRFVGTEREVLFEQPKSARLAAGYTDNYLRVEVHVPDAAEAAALRNRRLPVRLEAAGTGVHPVMRGRLAAGDEPWPVPGAG